MSGLIENLYTEYVKRIPGSKLWHHKGRGGYFIEFPERKEMFNLTFSAGLVKLHLKDSPSSYLLWREYFG